MDSRDRRCQITLRISAFSLPDGASADIYGFLRQPGGISGIFLGRLPAANGCVYGSIQVDPENLGDSGTSLRQLGGMIFFTDNGKTYATQWDDSPILPSSFTQKTADTEPLPQLPLKPRCRQTPPAPRSFILPPLTPKRPLPGKTPARSSGRKFSRRGSLSRLSAMMISKTASKSPPGTFPRFSAWAGASALTSFCCTATITTATCSWGARKAPAFWASPASIPRGSSSWRNSLDILTLSRPGQTSGKTRVSATGIGPLRNSRSTPLPALPPAEYTSKAVFGSVRAAPWNIP